MAEEIELVSTNSVRSEEIQEVIGGPTPWITRWGIFIFFLFTILILAISCIIRYPDIIKANFRLTALHSAQIVDARIDGQLYELTVRNHQNVYEGEVLGYIKIAADPTQVIEISNAVDSLIELLDVNKADTISNFILRKYDHLGGLQIEFQTFYFAFLKFKAFVVKGYSKSQKQLDEKKIDFLQTTYRFKTQIHRWKLLHQLTAPLAGQVSFYSFLQREQFVDKGQHLMYIIPRHINYIGRMFVSQFNFGKIKEGQKVIVKFDGYPFEEYGSVYGKIIAISNIPSSDSDYLVTVTLPHGLKTNYGKQLSFFEGMAGNGEIITADNRLISKFIYKIKQTVSR